MGMPKYKFPAKEGVITVEKFKIPKEVTIKDWHSFGRFVIVTTDKEVRSWEEYKIEE